MPKVLHFSAFIFIAVNILGVWLTIALTTGDFPRLQLLPVPLDRVEELYLLGCG